MRSATTPDTSDPVTRAEGPRRTGLGALGAVAATVALVLGADAWVGEVRAIGSDSMAPALGGSEWVLVAKAGLDRWDIPRGRIVVFDAADLWAAPGDPAGTVFVKRVIGIPGDRIRCCSSAGALERNGEEVDEAYLAGRATDQTAFEVVVAPGHYWLLGDDRAASADARAHLGDPGGGAVPASRIIGTVEAVVWPPGSMRRVTGVRSS